MHFEKLSPEQPVHGNTMYPIETLYADNRWFSVLIIGPKQVAKVSVHVKVDSSNVLFWTKKKRYLNFCVQVDVSPSPALDIYGMFLLLAFLSRLLCLHQINYP